MITLIGVPDEGANVCVRKPTIGEALDVFDAEWPDITLVTDKRTRAYWKPVRTGEWVILETKEENANA